MKWIEATGGEGGDRQDRQPSLPARQATRFGAFRPLSGETGCLVRVRGGPGNPVVGVSRHATSTPYVLRLPDPGPRFRTGSG